MLCRSAILLLWCAADVDAAFEEGNTLWVKDTDVARSRGHVGKTGAVVKPVDDNGFVAVSAHS